jgi:hypothetical protein
MNHPAEQHSLSHLPEEGTAAHAMTDDTLVWYGRAVYRSRVFCMGLLLIGAAWGLWRAVQQPLFRTVAILRVSNPLVGYHHLAYWEPQGRTVQSQVRLAAESFLPRGEFSVKSQTDAWMIRMDVPHQHSGTGEQIVQQVLEKVRAIGKQSAAADGHGPGPGKADIAAAAVLLDELQQLLATLRADSGLQPLDLKDLPPHALGQRYASDVMLRMPFDELPMAGRFRQLQAAVDRYFSDRAGKTSDSATSVGEQRLLLLQSQVMQQMLINWGRMDLFASAATENSLQLDMIHESRMTLSLVIAREVLLWTLIAAALAFLVIVPVTWTIDRWPQICGLVDNGSAPPGTTLQ